MLELIPSPQTRAFDTFADAVERGGVLCAPFITREPVERFIQSLTRRNVVATARLTVLTNLSASHLFSGSTDLEALMLLQDQIKHATITHLSALHAKVYIADESLALVTSGNFTRGGAIGNLEYGICVRDDATLARRISADLAEYARLGAAVTSEQLASLRGKLREAKAASEVERAELRKQQRALSVQVRQITTTEAVRQQAEEAVSNDLIRLHVAGETINAIFARTITYLLKTQGPLSTRALNEHVQSLHPDLCDDNADRVIDGIHYGKLWKHQVRNSQVFLRRRGDIAQDATTKEWRLM